MKDIFMGLYWVIIWLIPFYFAVRYKKDDQRFFIRKFLFPGQYWLQVLFEKWTGNSRSGTRLLHILLGLFVEPYAVLGLFGVIIIFINGGDFAKFMDANPGTAFGVTAYMFVSIFAFFFQPYAGQITTTK